MAVRPRPAHRCRGRTVTDAVTWQNLGPPGTDGQSRPGRSSWTWRGEPIPFVPLDEEWEPEAYEYGLIPLRGWYEAGREFCPDQYETAVIPRGEDHSRVRSRSRRRRPDLALPARRRSTERPSGSCRASHRTGRTACSRPPSHTPGRGGAGHPRRLSCSTGGEPRRRCCPGSRRLAAHPARPARPPHTLKGSIAGFDLLRTLAETSPAGVLTGPSRARTPLAAPHRPRHGIGSPPRRRSPGACRRRGGSGVLSGRTGSGQGGPGSLHGATSAPRRPRRSSQRNWRGRGLDRTADGAELFDLEHHLVAGAEPRASAYVVAEAVAEGKPARRLWCSIMVARQCGLCRYQAIPDHGSRIRPR